MVKEMKWHIYHKITGEPLCWDKKALEFDTKEDTENFLGSVILNYLGNVEDFDKNTEIKEDILYYDDGYLNATGFVVERDFDNNYEDLFLVKREASL